MKAERLYVARQKVTEKLNNVRTPQRPAQGWLRTIRELLGMTTYQFAKRLGIAQSSAVGLEKREKQKAITLRSLEEAARALNCRLEYILIPNEPFKDTLRKRATKLAQKRLLETSKSMELEDQSVSESDMKRHLDILIEQILNEGRSEIWEEN